MDLSNLPSSKTFTSIFAFNQCENAFANFGDFAFSLHPEQKYTPRPGNERATCSTSKTTRASSPAEPIEVRTSRISSALGKAFIQTRHVRTAICLDLLSSFFIFSWSCKRLDAQANTMFIRFDRNHFRFHMISNIQNFARIGDFLVCNF